MTVHVQELCPPLLVCVLGGFRIIKRGEPVTLRSGGKVEQLLGNLALRARAGIARDELLALVWPDIEVALASRSLNTLVYSLHRSLGDALGGRPPVLRRDGRYWLNTDEGVAVDALEFDAAAASGDRLLTAGDERGAVDSYDVAASLYAGDLSIGSDVRHLIERERLRARYLTVRARLADQYFAGGEYREALANALMLLAVDPCREDAHRMAMRCYVRLGERAQALRQYGLCRDALALEFDAPPERATEALFERVRLDPAGV